MKMLSWLLVLNFMLPLSFASMDGGDKEGKRGEYLKKELGLTDEQMAKIKDIREEHHQDLKASKQKFKAAKADFKTSMGNAKLTNEELEQKFSAFQSARGEFQTKRFKMMMAMRSILTAEQVTKFQAMKKKFREHKRKYGKGRKE